MQTLNRFQIAIAALAVALLSGWASYTAIMKAFGLEPPIARNARFSCGLRPDPERANRDVWTLNYHKGGRAGHEPWLYIVQEMEEGWTPDKRCTELEQRMNRLASDRLLHIDYKRAPDLPSGEPSRQFVLCGITEQTPQLCQLLLTLSVADSQQPEEVLQRATKALGTGKAIKQLRCRANAYS